MDEGDVAVLGEDRLRLAEEGLPALAVAGLAEAGDRGAELARALAEHLQAPEVDLLQLVELGREALEVEHDVVGVLGDRRRPQHDRSLFGQRPSAGENPVRLGADLLASPAPGPLYLRQRLGVVAAQKLVDRLTPRESSSPISPRSTHGKSPIDRSLHRLGPAALEVAAARALRPADDLMGRVGVEPDAKDRL